MWGRLVAAFAAAAVASAAQGPQLSLYPCNTSAPASFQWNFTGDVAGNTTGAFILQSTGQCVTYNVSTTNLVVDTCSGSDLQTFLVRPDGTFFNPSTQLCWDSQYYGNQSGSVLGLYDCFPDQLWDVFSFNGTVITNTQLQTMCVNGGAAPPPLPTPEQLAWIQQEVSLMVRRVKVCTA